MKSNITLRYYTYLLLAMVTVGFNVNLLYANDTMDFGLTVESLLKHNSEKLFGIKKPITNSAVKTKGAIRTPEQTAQQQIIAAKGLRVEYLTRNAANRSDMMAFWPSDQSATHLISCIEGKRETITADTLNPSVQSIHLQSGVVKTLIRGLDRCDGVRTTSWGTVLVNEESNDGSVYEILNPLTLNNEYVIDRASGEVSDAQNIRKITALATLSWEGFTVMDSGVIYNGDELRPGSNRLIDSDGGAIYKFIPKQQRLTNTKISSLDDSPLVAGDVYAMQISCKQPGSQWGQGCEVGNGGWIAVSAATARSDAARYGATGYYRPEDLHRDPQYTGVGIRFCWTNTGREKASHFAEVMCAIDAAPLDAQSQVIANRFIEGDSDFNSFDNLAFQPASGNLYVIEDHINGDIFSCLPDGADRDIKSDGCIKVLSVIDSSAEPSGFIFSADGKTAYLSIQHSYDSLMPDVDNYRTDDILKITGF